MIELKFKQEKQSKKKKRKEKRKEIKASRGISFYEKK
jgi:hypothetical protein